MKKQKAKILQAAKKRKQEVSELEQLPTLGLSAGQWVLVKYTIAKKQKCYVGKIITNCQGMPDRWEVHFLKRSHQNVCDITFTDSFNKDQAGDDVDEEDVVACLPSPTIRRGIYSFAFNFDGHEIE